MLNQISWLILARMSVSYLVKEINNTAFNVPERVVLLVMKIPIEEL